MTWEILFNTAFNKVEDLAKGEAEDSERVPEGAFTFGELRSIVKAIRKMGVDRNQALREAEDAGRLLDEIEAVLGRREA